MNNRFESKESFHSSEYELLPFKFSLLNDNSYFLSTDSGEWCCLDSDQLNALITKKLPYDEEIFLSLKSKNFISETKQPNYLDLISSKYKTKNNFIDAFSQLHIFVLTVRCNNSCIYCQASRKPCSSGASKYDMDDNILDKNIDLFLSMPSQKLTLEFQGGESTLNISRIRRAVQIISKKHTNKDIQYVVCTNLCEINDDDLDFLIENNFSISTSLDGPQFLHDSNRHYGKKSAYLNLKKNIAKIKKKGAFDAVSALMTTTRESLPYAKEIIDEYISTGFNNIFIRELNPYGFAQKYFSKIGYSTENFLEFYSECLNYIIELNKNGIHFKESFASLILKKLLTPWSTGFVDLQSPCGAGFSVTTYNYDGNIYPSDESRMMAETGDQFFKMGNILKNTYKEIFFGETMQKLASAGINDSLPGCCDCAYSPYCGADPVRRYQTTGSIYGHPGKDEFCKKNMGIIKIIINKLVNADKETKKILMQWGIK